MPVLRPGLGTVTLGVSFQLSRSLPKVRLAVEPVDGVVFRGGGAAKFWGGGAKFCGGGMYADPPGPEF